MWLFITSKLNNLCMEIGKEENPVGFLERWALRKRILENGFKFMFDKYILFCLIPFSVIVSDWLNGRMMQEALVMSWRIIQLEGWRFMCMSYLANTTRKSFRKTRDVSTICLLLRSTCIGSSYPAQLEPIIQRKQIGFILLSTLLVTLPPLACHCPSSHRGWWEVQYSSFLQTGLIGIKQKEPITSLLFPMTLEPAFITR